MIRLRVLLYHCCGIAVSLCLALLLAWPDSPDKATSEEKEAGEGTAVPRPAEASVKEELDAPSPESAGTPKSEDAGAEDERETEEEEAEPKATLLSQLPEYEDKDDAAFFQLLETAVKKDLDLEYPESGEPAVTEIPEEDDEEDEEDEETDEEPDESETEEVEADEAGVDEEAAEEEEGAEEEEPVARPCTPRADVLSCLTRMKAAYEAHMEFARCSLSVIRETHPESYERTMATFRSALRRQCCRDLDTLRSSNLWCPCGPRPKNDEPRRDAFVHAPVRNASGFGVRGQTAYHIKLREDMLKLRQDFVAEQMQNHTLAGVEYLTNRQFEERAEEAYYEPKPTPHSKELLKLFRKAEKRWLKYSEDGAMAYHCGDGTFVGTDTYQFVYFDVIFRLWDHHEDFLLELLTCFHSSEE